MRAIQYMHVREEGNWSDCVHILQTIRVVRLAQCLCEYLRASRLYVLFYGYFLFWCVEIQCKRQETGKCAKDCAKHAAFSTCFHWCSRAASIIITWASHSSILWMTVCHCRSCVWFPSYCPREPSGLTCKPRVWGEPVFWSPLWNGDSEWQTGVCFLFVCFA